MSNAFQKLGLPGPMKHEIDRKRVVIQQRRIDACDVLLDYLHDDVPWKDQQPMKDMLTQLKRDFESEMEDAINE